MAELSGYGCSSDASHLTHPDTTGQVNAMRHAIADANLQAEQIDYLNAHGTATLVGDAVEAQSIHSVFGAHAAQLPVSSTKAVHGHLMGAGGAIELAIAMFAMNKGVIPPTANCRKPDAGLNIDMVPDIARKKHLRHVMSNSFAFGGSNAVLIASQYQAE
jgi:3-oxoacyl-[acyl-carrier-protein] synthase II